MRLVDVQIARQAHNHWPATRPARTSAAWSTLTPALQTAALALRAVAKFLNAFLKIVLAAGAKILRPSLRPGDAHGFRCSFRSCTVEGQRGNVIAISTLHATQHA